MRAPDGFAEFVASDSTALLRAGWLLTGDWPAAEDLVQTALAETWLAWDRIRRTDAPRVYAHTIMVRTYLRWRGRRWVGEIPTGRLPELERVDAALEAADLRQTLLDTLDRLPPRQRAIIVLRYLEDLTESQTAAVLGCSVGTVKSQSSKALARLRVAPGLAEAIRGGVS